MNILQTKTGYECPILRVEERLVEHNGEEEIHYVVVRQPNVTIFAETNDHKIVMIEQKRGRDNKIQPEFSSGKLTSFNPPMEKIEKQARIELREETGFIAKELKLLQNYQVNSNWLERDYYLFAAWDLEMSEKELGEFEEIETKMVPLQTLEELLKDGTIQFQQERAGAQQALYFFRNLRKISSP